MRVPHRGRFGSLLVRAGRFKLGYYRDPEMAPRSGHIFHFFSMKVLLTGCSPKRKPALSAEQGGRCVAALAPLFKRNTTPAEFVGDKAGIATLFHWRGAVTDNALMPRACMRSHRSQKRYEKPCPHSINRDGRSLAGRLERFWVTYVTYFHAKIRPNPSSPRQSYGLYSLN